MTTYQCEKGHLFVHPTKIRTYLKASDNPKIMVAGNLIVADQTDFREETICPECHTLKYKEYVEPQPEIEAVYVHDLVSGDQTALTEMLAKGWVIVARYAKQYHLEKPKVAVAEAPLPKEAVEAYQKLEAKP